MPPPQARPASRARQRLFPFGALRVRLRFAGAEVIQHRKNPPHLIGRIFAWDQMGRFGTFSRLEDERGSPVRCEGRRWFVKIDDTRQIRIANRLRTRRIRDELRSGRSVRDYARPESSMRWIMWTLATMLAAMIVTLIVPAFGGTMNWLRGQSLSMQVVAGLTLAGTLLMYAMMVAAAYNFGWKAGLPMARRIIYDAEGFAAEISTGEIRQIEWSTVRRMHRDWTAYRLDVAGQDPIRLPMTGVTRVVLAEVKDRTQQRDVQVEANARNDLIRNGLARRLVWRITVWSSLGGVLAVVAIWWIKNQGLNPAPLTLGRYLAGIATFAFIPALFWLAYLFGDSWNRLSLRVTRKWRRHWRQLRTKTS